MTSYTFKNGVTVDIPAANKQQEIKKWNDINWQMMLILDPPPPADPPKERKKYTLSYEGYQKRKLIDKARFGRKKKK